MERLRENRQISEFYKMLLFLNESTSDYFFLWDIKEGQLYFAREILIKKEEGKAPGYVYTLDSVLGMIYANDRARISNILQNIREGNYNSINEDFRYLDEDARKCWINCRGKVLCNEAHKTCVMIGCLSRKILSDKIDLLTGLMNYNKLLENLEKNINCAQRGHLLIIGVDNFRDINQRMGRPYGNSILKNTAEILQDMEYPSYRMDGDHFAVDLMGCSRRDTEKYFALFREKTKKMCSFSAGIVAYPFEKEKNAGILVTYAENALERAKNAGKNRIEYFSTEDYDRDVSRIELQQEIRESIQNGFRGFQVYYQPQVASNKYDLCGAEALLRYHSPKFGFLSPAVFIPVLERGGMIIPVGRWVLKEALSQCAKWRILRSDFRISVNVSYVQLREKSIVEDVMEALRESGLPGNSLTLEITESMQLQDYSHFNDMFSFLREKGIQISIDDFGTGYSSLSYLKGLEVDEVKIDRCFVSQVQKNAYNFQLLRNMLDLAHSAQIKVCCEGVELEEELQCLDTLFPELVQGFLFGKPVDAAAFENTFLVPNESYTQLIDRLTKHNREEKIIPPNMAEEQKKYRDFKNILNNLDTIIYIMDAKTHELYYMNTPAKKFTGVYDYEGKRCFQVLYNRSHKCKNCCMGKWGYDESSSSKLLYESYGEHMSVHQKYLYWEDKPSVLVSARYLDKDQQFLDYRINEELRGASQIIKMYDSVFMSADTETFMNRLLENLGFSYQCDRACLFLWDAHLDIWQSAYHYRAEGVMDKPKYFELTTSDRMAPWLRLIENRDAVFIEDIQNLPDERGELYQGMENLDNNNCMLCAVRGKNGIQGLLVLDNVDVCRNQTDLLKKASELVSRKLFQSEDTSVELDALHRIVEQKMEQEILSCSQMGLWQITHDRKKNTTILLADDNMKELLGIKEAISPAQCYQWWYSRISSGYCYYVDNAVETMLTSGKIVEIHYTWNHPLRGEVTVRGVGRKISENDGIINIEGYYRLVDDVERMQVHAEPAHESFEYHEESHMIYFHTGRNLFAGSERKEENFPETWVKRRIVHPDSREKFEELFRNASQKEGRLTVDVQLMNKEREYQWYHLTAVCPRKDARDMHSMHVTAVPV